MTDDSFEVVSDRFAQMKVEVFSIHGQLLEAKSEMTNTQVDLAHLRGLLVLSIEIDGQHFARRFFRPWSLNQLIRKWFETPNYSKILSALLVDLGRAQINLFWLKYW